MFNLYSVSRGCAATVACASAFISCQVAAQSQLTIYGVLDNAVQTTHGKGDKGQTLTELTPGYFAASRLGFKGLEDLGGGMSSFFQLEMGIASDTGAMQQGGRAFGRTSQVGIGTPWGSLAFGRLGTPGSGTGPYNMTNGPKNIDPFYLGYGAAGWANTINVGALPLRGDNSIVYRTPSMKNGLTFAGLYSFQRDGNELPGGSSANTGVIGLGLSYDNGPLFAMATYDRIHNPVSGQPDQTALQLGAVYDFNVLKLHVLAGRERGEFLFSTAVEAAASDATFADVGMTIPVGAGRVMLGVQSRNATQATGGYDRRIASVGYAYNLSKRTALNMAVSNSIANKSLSGNGSYNFWQVGLGVSHFF